METKTFKPILFNTEIVQAILEGRKTQTRRVCNPQPEVFIIERVPITMSKFTKLLEDFQKRGFESLGMGKTAGWILPKKKYQKGDILWVRESAIIYKIEGTTGFHYCGEKPVGFKSIQKIGIEYMDGERKLLDYPERLSLNINCGNKLSNGIFREAARIFLKVTDVRCERLNDISGTDALQEGVKLDNNLNNLPEKVKNAIQKFETLWDSINSKKHPWKSNPWVWVYTFERIEKPADFN